MGVGKKKYGGKYCVLEQKEKARSAVEYVKIEDAKREQKANKSRSAQTKLLNQSQNRLR
jgi:hypothetical protein